MIAIVAVLLPTRIAFAVGRVLVKNFIDIGTRIVKPTLRGTASSLKRAAKRTVAHAIGNLSAAIEIDPLHTFGKTPQPFLGTDSETRIVHRSKILKYGRNPMNYALWLHQGHVVIGASDRSVRRWSPGRRVGGRTLGRVQGDPYLRRAARTVTPLVQRLVSSLTRQNLQSIARGNFIQLNVTRQEISKLFTSGAILESEL